MTGFLEASGPFAPLVVFLLAGAESAAFMGLFVPGELAVILGGVAAGTGSVSLWSMILAAVLGAVVGDSIGYRLGATLGSNLIVRSRTAKLTRHTGRAAAMLSERGWWALVVARFASVLRAVVPFAAGMGHMPYRRFLVGNVIGGAAWGSAFTVAGYLAGTNYPRVEKWFRTGGLTVAGVVVIVAAIVWVTRWTQHHQDEVLAAVRRITSTRLGRRATGLLRRPRLGGLALTLAAVTIVGGVWLFAGLTQDVLGSEEFFFLDLATTRYLSLHRIDQLIGVARVVDAVTDPGVLLSLAGAAVVATLLRRRRRRALALVTSVAGQWAIVEGTARLVHRLPPSAVPLAVRTGYGFPSEHVALLMTLAVAAAWAWKPTEWQTTVRRYGIAAVVVAVTGISRVLLLIEYPSDTIAAAAVATAWTLVVHLASAGAADDDVGPSEGETDGGSSTGQQRPPGSDGPHPLPEQPLPW